MLSQVIDVVVDIVVFDVVVVVVAANEIKLSLPKSQIHTVSCTLVLQTTFLIVDEAVSETDLVVEADKFFAANESGKLLLRN